MWVYTCVYTYTPIYNEERENCKDTFLIVVLKKFKSYFSRPTNKSTSLLHESSSNHSQSFFPVFQILAPDHLGHSPLKRESSLSLKVYSKCGLSSGINSLP